ncbi:ribbon-helix-helix domain-containing protein [Telmatobacter bradus]|uniref:ribbon-helix-helix domain-containing protein n=1 Tax=Telmatobacter bradus TaxID=474953 RepID=UPI003B43CA29
MTTLTVSMPDSLKDFIESEVATKGYGNVSEYIRTLVRGEQERQTRMRLEALLLEGLNSGEQMAVTPEFWSELRSDAATILARKKKSGKGHSQRESTGAVGRAKRYSAAD